MSSKQEQINNLIMERLALQDAIERALNFINEACNDDEAINHNKNIGRAIEDLREVL